jgi:hypothetical protein
MFQLMIKPLKVNLMLKSFRLIFLIYHITSEIEIDIK